MIPDPRLPDPVEVAILGGSFRDPSGYVFRAGNRIFRTVNSAAAEDFQTLIESGVLDNLVERGLALPAETLKIQPGMECAFRGPRGETPAALIEHPLIPFITYPFEWCFSQLKDAALAHLDLQIASLERGFVLSDATPYNMQFLDGRFVHIDTLSLRPYREGELWQGYNQFCRMFLAPLLVESWARMGFQPLLRGRVDGIPVADASKLLPKHRLFTSLQAMIHVHLHGKSEVQSSSSNTDASGGPARTMPGRRYLALLTELRRFVAGLSSGKRSKSFWREYASVNSYSEQMRSQKAEIVREFVVRNDIRSLVDIGGNSGDYAKIALEAGTVRAAVLDGDNDSVEMAYERAKGGVDGLSAWLVDIADPSPGMGWNGREREPITDRLDADGLLALAVIHHMCIGRNIPLAQAVSWLVARAPHGIIEFVPKSDPMVCRMLAGRDDRFSDYDVDSFIGYLGKHAAIVTRCSIDGSDRVFVEYASRHS